MESADDDEPWKVDPKLHVLSSWNVAIPQFTWSDSPLFSK